MKQVIKLLAVLILAGVAIAAMWIGRQLFRPYEGHSGNVIVVIDPGTRAPAVVQMLVDRGVLAARFPFLSWYAIGRVRGNRMKAGEYLFDRPFRPVDVYWKLAHGDVYLHAVLIPEGSDRFDMADIFQRDLSINPDVFLRASQQTELVKDLDPQATTLEGYLFPDTYRFPRGVSAERVVKTMVARFRQVYAAAISPNLQKTPSTLHDVITLASLVEKETPNPDERAEVAGVFTRRLQMGMPLACDPTVVYSARLDHRMLERPLPPIKRSDLEFDSPYNTYLHTGLPPGPIASPGEASIRAALAPAPGDALYFVSNNHGGHYFASTLAEHERNVARYRQEIGEVPAVPSSTDAKTPGAALTGKPGPDAPAKNALNKSPQHSNPKRSRRRMRHSPASRATGRA